MRPRFSSFWRLVVLEVILLASSTSGSVSRSNPFVAAFDFGCAGATTLPASIRSLLEERIRRQGPLGTATWLDRAVRVDLNGDAAGEFFVPYDCGATGNCLWGLFDGSTMEPLGDLEAAVIYLGESPKRGWPILEAFLTQGAAQAWVSTYRWRSGRYERGEWSRLIDPTGNGPIHRYRAARPAVPCAPDPALH